ncbi:MAG: acyl-CoA thioester hydrolase/BAAT C-terminal domain-containing protein, partial [Candidatus Methanosuratincola petrocarbonis]
FEGVSKAMGIDHKSSWTLNGEEVPFVPIVFNQQLSDSFFSSKLANEPWSTAPMYAYALENKEAVDAATIQVEKINGPILLVSGSEDGVWPAETMAKAIMDRLKAKGHPFPDMHLNYEGAGHQIGAPYSPTTINWLTVSGGLVEDLGGSPQRNAAAALDSWTKITVFLQEHLR